MRKIGQRAGSLGEIHLSNTLMNLPRRVDAELRQVLDLWRYKARLIIRPKISLYVAKKFYKSDKIERFSVVEIELRSLCNGTCPFCAAAVQYKSRPDKFMTDDMFRKIINDLSEADYSGRICFYINTEPLLDSRLADFVEYSRRSCPKATLHVMTNGIKLTNELGKRLLKNGLDLLEINNYSHDGLVRGNVKNFMSDVAPLYPGKVRLNMRPLNVILNNRAGSAPNGRVLKKPLKAFCQRPWDKMMISVDGIVGLCEHDFYFSERMGKVSENRLEDIWNSTEFKKVREHLSSGDRTVNSLCSSCDFHGYRRIANPKESYAGVRSSGKSVLEKILILLNRI